MLRLTLAGVRGHLVRFLLTACAVMLGVSFVSGTFVLRDSIDNALSSLFSQSLKGVDVQVRGVKSQATGREGSDRASLPLALETQLRAVPGVARVAADLQGTAVIAGKDGLPVRSGGAPGFGFPFRADDPAFELVAGRGPTNVGEIAVERTTLEQAALQIGDRTQAMIGASARPVTITGEVVFGSMFGATAILLDEQSARTAFSPDGAVSSFSVTAAPGVGQEQLRTAVAPVLPNTAEAVTGTALDAEAQKDLNTGLGFFTTFLLTFAGVALFVGAFIIVNTFSMLLGQRTRELAMLRAVGASRRQVMAMVLGEAAVIGAVGSGLGIGLGLLIAAGAKSGIHRFIGADIGGSLPVRTGTVVWSIVVGVVVTLLAALVPARRASRIAPVAAMRDDLVIAPKGLRLRGSIGGAMVIAGMAGLVYAVTRSSASWPLAGAGAAAAVLGALVAAPLTTRPVVRVIAWPFAAVAGVVGRLARQNALRVPRRTALTASALMIGLALISGLAVIAQSVKASVSDIVTQELRSDYVLDAGNNGTVPPSVAPAVAALPQVQSVAAVGGVGVKVGDVDTFALAADPAALADNVAIDVRSGSLSAVAHGEVLLNQTLATKHGWTVGQQVSLTAGPLPARQVRIGAVYADSQILGEVLVGRALYEQAVPVRYRGDYGVYVKAEPGADLAALRTALAGVAKPYLVVSVEDGAGYVKSSARQIDIILNLLSALLLFSVIVAVLGIVNTLALSITERTREIGLLRAVGLGRRQLAGMITVESVATAVFGAVPGGTLGIGLGVSLQRGLRTQGLDVLSVPWATLGGMLLAASVVGVLAAVIPAARAVRLNVLQAIATD